MLFRPTYSPSYSGNVLLLLIEGKTGNVFTKLKIIGVIVAFQIRQKYFKKEKLASLEDQDLEEGSSQASNQIYLATLRPTQLTQASFLQKKSNVAKCFLISFTLR